MSVSVDSAVSLLVDNISDAQRKHRLIAMRQNELENKLSLATADNKALREKHRLTVETEMKLKKDLEKLTEDHRALQLLIMTESDRFRHCELEEPLLQKHVDEKIALVRTKLEEWRVFNQNLEKLSSLLGNDKTTIELKEKLQIQESSVRELTNCKRQTQQELDDLKNQIQKERDDAETRRLFPLLSGHKHLFTFNEADEDLLQGFPDQETRIDIDSNWEQIISQTFLNMRSSQREVEYLRKRSDELARWLNERNNSRVELLQYCEYLNSCTTSKLCLTCIGSI